MKVTWEEGDVDCGRRVTTNKLNHDILIGYRVTNTGNIYGLTDLRDGHFIGLGTKADVAGSLNDAGYIPVEIARK